MSTAFIHLYGLVYKAHYLCPVTAPSGFTFQLLTAEGEFMSNDTTYPSPQAAVEAGKQFLDRWLFRSIFHSMCDELYEQGQMNYAEYAGWSQVIREAV
ncbi:hypothetical protein NDA01_21465 [Trichocoleus desertorum AS-A10]|uniref:hypothetical protein n=1 Tax=Trichocoleus desertorum TaxID=1481672 RepID=UPI0032971645